MTLTEAMTTLEGLANASTRKQYLKAGAGENQFGVRAGDIRALAKRIKTDHALALQLWETGNVDARLLAILILKVKLLSRADVDRMVRSLTFSNVADWLMNYVVKDHPDKESLRVEWMAATEPWAARAGWSLTAGRVAREPEGLDLSALLNRIEAEMADAPAPSQWTMNTCLAYIGIHHPAHRERALAIGEALGVLRDYPTSKGCTSPFAPIWIAEIVRRQG